MRYLVPNLLVAAVGLLAMPALAQPPEDSGEKADRPRREEFRERMIKEFDKDGDGKLSDEERQNARDAMRERFGRRGQEGRRGRDGKGQKGGPDRRSGFRGPEGGPPPQRVETLFNRFDEDKSDSLNRDEFAKLAEFLHQHRPPRPPGGPGGPPHGPRFDGRGPDGPPPGADGFRRRFGPDGPPPPGPDGPRRPPRDKQSDQQDDEHPRLNPDEDLEKAI